MCYRSNLDSSRLSLKEFSIEIHKVSIVVRTIFQNCRQVSFHSEASWFFSISLDTTIAFEFFPKYPSGTVRETVPFSFSPNFRLVFSFFSIFSKRILFFPVFSRAFSIVRSWPMRGFSRILSEIVLQNRSRRRPPLQLQPPVALPCLNTSFPQ